MSWVYTVNTKAFHHNGKYMFSANYAGAPSHKNRSELECVKNKGPLPRGRYKISKPMASHPTAGAYVLRLIPYADNNMCDRDGFLIHGDNRTGTASNGCIILRRDYREDIARSGDGELVVR